MITDERELYNETGRPTMGGIATDTMTIRPDTRPQWKRWLAELFPWEPCEAPDSPPSWKETIVTRTGAHITWCGRLLILWSGRIEVETRTAAQHECGKTETKGITRILPPRWLERR